MRLLTVAGTPREFQVRISACFAVVIMSKGRHMLLLIVVATDQTAAVAITFGPDPRG